MTKFKGEYRIESARMSGWDYTTPGWYFVTFCTKGHICHLGQIKAGEMHLSSIGVIVAEEWQKTPLIRPNVVLDAWMIMPNHVHGIIAIVDVDQGVVASAGPARCDGGVGSDPTGQFGPIGRDGPACRIS